MSDCDQTAVELGFDQESNQGSRFIADRVILTFMGRQRLNRCLTKVFRA
jgi:hypothetical protein